MDSRSTSRPFPGFSHLYSLSTADEEKAFITDVDLPEGMDIGALYGGEVKPDRPLVARWEMGGTTPQDVIGSTWGGLTLIFSERVVQMLTEHHFTGWSSYPIDVFRKNRVFVARYHGIQVLGRCGPIDTSRCNRVMVQYPGGVFPFSKGLFFDEDSWDGSDFVNPANSGWTVVTEEVKKAFEKMKARDISFRALDEIVLHKLFDDTP